MDSQENKDAILMKISEMRNYLSALTQKLPNHAQNKMWNLFDDLGQLRKDLGVHILGMEKEIADWKKAHEDLLAVRQQDIQALEQRRKDDIMMVSKMLTEKIKHVPKCRWESI